MDYFSFVVAATCMAWNDYTVLVVSRNHEEDDRRVGGLKISIPLLQWPEFELCGFFLALPGNETCRNSNLQHHRQTVSHLGGRLAGTPAF